MLNGLLTSNRNYSQKASFKGFRLNLPKEFLSLQRLSDGLPAKMIYRALFRYFRIDGGQIKNRAEAQNMSTLS